MALPSSNLYRIPDELSFEEAASIPVVFITAWEMLINKSNILPGNWVLVNSAGSGVGIAAIQLAKMLGAQIITNASTHIKRDMGLSLGADHSIDYTTQGWSKEVLSIADKIGVHLAADNVGGNVLVETWESLPPGGTA